MHVYLAGRQLQKNRSENVINLVAGGNFKYVDWDLGSTRCLGFHPFVYFHIVCFIFMTHS